MAKAKFDIKHRVDRGTRGLHAGVGVADLAVETVKESSPTRRAEALRGRPEGRPEAPHRGPEVGHGLRVPAAGPAHAGHRRVAARRDVDETRAPTPEARRRPPDRARRSRDRERRDRHRHLRGPRQARRDRGAASSATEARHQADRDQRQDHQGQGEDHRTTQAKKSPAKKTRQGDRHRGQEDRKSAAKADRPADPAPRHEAPAGLLRGPRAVPREATLCLEAWPWSSQFESTVGAHRLLRAARGEDLRLRQLAAVLQRGLRGRRQAHQARLVLILGWAWR